MKSLWILIFSAASFASASAVTPIVWKQDTQEAFSKGDAASVSITRDGAIRLGPTLTEYADTGEEFVWSIARDRKNRIFAGTGNEGRVYRLSEGSSERPRRYHHVSENQNPYDDRENYTNSLHRSR